MSSSPSDERKPRFRSRLAVVTVATTITAVLVAASGVLQASAAAPATRGDMHVTRGAPSTLAKLRPRPSVTPKPSAIPTPTPTASPAHTATTAPSPTVTASTTASPSGCTVLIFNAQSYCAGTLTGVNRTAYGLGQR